MTSLFFQLLSISPPLPRPWQNANVLKTLTSILTELRGVDINFAIGKKLPDVMRNIDYCGICFDPLDEIVEYGLTEDGIIILSRKDVAAPNIWKDAIVRASSNPHFQKSTQVRKSLRAKELSEMQEVSEKIRKLEPIIAEILGVASIVPADLDYYFHEDLQAQIKLARQFDKGPKIEDKVNVVDEDCPAEDEFDSLELLQEDAAQKNYLRFLTEIEAQKNLIPKLRTFKPKRTRGITLEVVHRLLPEHWNTTTLILPHGVVLMNVFSNPLAVIKALNAFIERAILNERQYSLVLEDISFIRARCGLKEIGISQDLSSQSRKNLFVSFPSSSFFCFSLV